jgi:hypothetical protein
VNNGVNAVTHFIQKLTDTVAAADLASEAKATKEIDIITKNMFGILVVLDRSMA